MLEDAVNSARRLYTEENVWQKRDTRKKEGWRKRSNKVANCDTRSYENLVHATSRPCAYTTHICTYTCIGLTCKRRTNTRAYVRIVDLPLGAEIRAAS